MDDSEFALRREIVATARQLNSTGINQGTSGNVSARWRDGMLITPSGVEYDTMRPGDIVFVDANGATGGRLAPSSEWRFHLDILNSRADIGAVVHAHPVHCTALAMCRKPIRAVHYMIAAAKGPVIECAGYATYGSKELSENILAALGEQRLACLMANHGMVAGGPNLAKALWLAVEVETLAHQYIIALQIGKPVVLDDAEISTVIEKFKSYGPGAQE